VVVSRTTEPRSPGPLDAAGGPLQYIDDGQSLEFQHWGVPSPDGRFVAFDVKERPEKESLDVFLYDAAAGRDIPVVSGPANDRVVGWSPSGRELLASGPGVGRDVWSVAIENGSLRASRDSSGRISATASRSSSAGTARSISRCSGRTSTRTSPSSTSRRAASGFPGAP
jgi:Tol biopolymer transport system component